MKKPTFKPPAFVALFTLAFAALSVLASGARTASASNPQRTLGDSQIFASVPTPPGFPEAIAVNGDRVYVSGPAQNPNDPSQPLPWVNPSAVAFNDKTRSLLVTNHAIFAPNPEPLFAVFDVFVDDKADHLARPNLP